MTRTRRAVVVLPDPHLLAESTASRLLLAVLDAQSVGSPVHVVLTGGTVGIATLEAARRSPLLGAVDFSGVHVWWGDERFLPAGDPDRNETQARAALLDHLPLPEGNIHAVPGPDRAASPEAAAEAYAAELAEHAKGTAGTAGTAGDDPDDSAGAGGAAPVPVPAFAVLLLGVGPDGHVASLFPGLPGVDVRDAVAVGVLGSPKPPPRRVSLTLPAIARAHQVWLVAAGAEKAPVIARALAGAPAGEIPAAAVAGRDGTLWLLDAAAAGLGREEPTR